MFRPTLVALAVLAAPAFAGIKDAVDTHVLPALDEFASASADLAAAAEDDCSAQALRPAYQVAFDAWMGISHLRFGPMEQNGRALAIALWPDERGMVRDTVDRMLDDEDPIAADPNAFADVSIAGRGLFALERLIYETDYAEGSYACTYAQAVTSDLSRMAKALRSDWRDNYTTAISGAGEEGNTVFLSQDEPAQAFYTALTTGLEFIADQRLGRPLGTFDRPRPERAEARRSDRSLRNVVLSLQATHDLATALADVPTPNTDAAFAAALEQADGIDPLLADVTDPAGRLGVEILQQRVGAILPAIANEIGVPLGVSAGFNASDGD
ncbi:Imelysin [Rhodobacteraceae bacterium THAF1]|uniref:imelysin family protein n=1 Tax=Palleronia sp. THAF1 TaxID=2587842 RepID=UPI000F3D02BE|nr:imelysin family protein [Palleronia sp. THAF1]QFU08796.1 Imelysin [Palleronia sp. THAF1]VDC23931.1 Imelysin [Rhodobacteraceae bacterium THAF1]